MITQMMAAGKWKVAAETKAEQVTGKKEKAASPKASKQVEASAEVRPSEARERQ